MEGLFVDFPSVLSENRDTDWEGVEISRWTQIKLKILNLL